MNTEHQYVTKQALFAALRDVPDDALIAIVDAKAKTWPATVPTVVVGVSVDSYDNGKQGVVLQVIDYDKVVARRRKRKTT